MRKGSSSSILQNHASIHTFSQSVRHILACTSLASLSVSQSVRLSVCLPAMWVFLWAEFFLSILSLRDEKKTFNSHTHTHSHTVDALKVCSLSFKVKKKETGKRRGKPTYYHLQQPASCPIKIDRH